MKRFTMFACLTMAMVFALGSIAGELPRFVDGHYDVIHGGNLDMSKAAARDTVYLIGPWGSGALANGQFEDASGVANWNGWTSYDITQKTEAVWHVDTYKVITGTKSAWCGDISYAPCVVGVDPEGGYGPDYNEMLSFVGKVFDKNNPSTVNVTATVNHNVEECCDFVYLGYFKFEAPFVPVWTGYGVGVGVPVVSGAITYLPTEYVGDNGDEVRITWLVTSDGGWDDADCDYYGDGAMQLDDVHLTMTNDFLQGGGTGIYDDGFETDLGNWVVEFPIGVGDYAHILSQLADEDPCNSDYTPMMTFIADDVMFNLGGNPVSYCQDWCYGPGGYIVDTQGGFAGPTAHIHNSVKSPIIAWPTGDYLGTSFLFDIYRHMTKLTGSAGNYYEWAVRSTDSAVAADIEGQGWLNRGYVYYGGPDYIRTGDTAIADLLVPGRTFIQVSFGVNEIGWIWGRDGDNGWPAPYFDNVKLICYDFFGPGMAMREIDMAQDNFPSVDLPLIGGLGTADVRFDMAQDISLQTETWNDPGDTIVLDIVAVRTNSTLVTVDGGGATAPRMYFIVKGNPVFDKTLRTFQVEADWATWGGVLTAGTDEDAVYYEGYVVGAPAMSNGVPSPTRWMFDLPDENFLYPGDVVHYYFEAWDDVASDFQNATTPADLTGFDDFSHPLAYNSSFTMHALPTFLDALGAQPSILFWNDFANRGGENEWYGALDNLGFEAGVNYDIYYTMGPSSGVGNGIGGRALLGQLDGYTAMLYTAGDLAGYTITEPDFTTDAGDDVGIVSAWLSTGNKLLFATGDGLAAELADGADSAPTFLSSWFGINVLSNDLRPTLGGDTAPMVYPVAANSVFQTTSSWVAYGGCRQINTFDAVTVNGAEKLAYFNDGLESIAAATKFVGPDGSNVVYMPYDFMFIYNPPALLKAGQPATLTARAQVLEEVLLRGGTVAINAIHANAVGVNTPKVVFDAQAYPNPFNPVTKIEFTMPKAGHVSLKVFTVRGELVKTLINEVRAEGTDFVMWDGTSDQGKRVSSGVYFYEVRTAENVLVKKLAMVK